MAGNAQVLLNYCYVEMGKMSGVGNLTPVGSDSYAGIADSAPFQFQTKLRPMLADARP